MKRSITFLLVLAVFLTGLLVYGAMNSQDAAADSDIVLYRFPGLSTTSIEVLSCTAVEFLQPACYSVVCTQDMGCV
ncbi:MAG: hypothetical protein HQK89_02705 [Nitrospirae bacterium]|nr:hypothetical protein [Nitrospirota bacterium]